MTQLLKIYGVLTKLKLLWFLLVAFLLAFGFGFKTPSSQFREIRATQDTFRVRLRHYGIARDSDASLIKALSIAQCIDRLSKGAEGKKELQLMQMPCNDLLGSR